MTIPPTKTRLKIFLAIATAFLTFAQIPVSNAQFSDTYDLLRAIDSDDIVTVRQKIFAGANVNARKDGVPALIMAIKNRSYDLAELLLENGAYINIYTLPQQETALMVATIAGDQDAVKLLLKYHPDLNAIDKLGRTALMKAASGRQSAVAKLLINNGADVFQTDFVGRDAMQYAKEARSQAIIQLLEDAGVS